MTIRIIEKAAATEEEKEATATKAATVVKRADTTKVATNARKEEEEGTVTSVVMAEAGTVAQRYVNQTHLQLSLTIYGLGTAFADPQSRTHLSMAEEVETVTTTTQAAAAG